YRGAELVLVAREDVLADDVDTFRLVEETVDTHGLDHDAAEILPVRERDLTALLIALLGEGDGQVGKRALMPLWVDDGGQPPPEPGRHAGRNVQRQSAKNTGDETQQNVFGAPLQVA